MANDAERLELARVFNRTLHLLHHHHMRRVLQGAESDSMPAITAPQVHMLMTVREHGQMTIKQLTQALRVKAPAVSAMVDRLEEVGLLVREVNPADRREVFVRVSPDAEARMVAMEQRCLQLTVEMFERIGLENVRMWGELCKRIQDALAVEQAL